MNSMEIALRELLECSICSDIFEDPRQLSCVHTFCLRCLEGIVQHNQQIRDVICPLCRNVSKLPPQGVQSLQKNHFIAKVKEVLLISRHHCDICEGEDISLDLFYCIDCEQRFCGKCRRDAHNNKIQIMRNHQLVDLRNGESVNEIARNIDQNRCEEHRDETIKMFCSDCRLAVCMVCFAVNHSKHECEDISRVCDGFREQLQQNITTVAHYEEQCVLICEDLEKERTNFLDEVITCESSVADTTYIIKQLVDAHATQLLGVLESLKTSELTNIESRKAEMKKQAAILKSYNRYTKEVIDKGSFKDMSHMMTDLNKRAEDLKQASESYLELDRVQHIQSGVVFTSSSLCDDFRDVAVDENVIGMITKKAVFIKPEKDSHNNNTEKLETMETELTSARNEIDKLNKVISSTKAENCDLQSRLNSCLGNEKKLKTQLEQARKTETRITEMEEKTKKATEAKHVSEDEMKKLIEEIEHHRQIVTKLRSEGENLRKFAEEKHGAEEKIKNLTADVNQHNQTIKKLMYKIKNLNILVDEKNEVEKKAKKLMIEVDQYRKTIEEVRAEREHLQKEIQRCNQEILNMKEENKTPLKPNSSEKTDEERSIIRQNIDALQLQLDYANAAIDRERKEKETLNKRLAVSEKEKKAIILMKQNAFTDLNRERRKNEELGAVKVAHKEMSLKLAIMQEAGEKISKDVSLVRMERDELKQMVVSQEKLISQLAPMKETSEKAFRELALVIKEKERLQEIIDSLKNEHIGLRSEIRATTEKRDELLSMLASTNAILEKMSNDMFAIEENRDKLRENINLLKHKNEELERTLDEANQNQRTMQHNNDAMSNEIQRLNIEIQTANEARDQLCSLLSSAKDWALGISNALAAVTKEKVALQEVVNSLTNDNISLNRELEQSSMMRDKLCTQLVSAKNETQKMKNELMEVTKDRKEFEEIANSLTTEKLRLCCELKRSNDALKETSSQLVSAGKRAEETLNDLAMMKQGKDHSEELETIKRSRDELASQLASAKVKANEMAVAKEEIIKLREVTNSLKIKHVGLKKQLTDANNNHRRLQSNYDAIVKERNRLNSELSRTTIDNTYLRNIIAPRPNQVETGSEELQLLRLQHDALSRELDRLKITRARTTEELERVQLLFGILIMFVVFDISYFGLFA